MAVEFEIVRPHIAMKLGDLMLSSIAQSVEIEMLTGEVTGLQKEVADLEARLEVYEEPEEGIDASDIGSPEEPDVEEGHEPGSEAQS